MTPTLAPPYQRIVIVDPQLKGQLGHNYRYLQAIAEGFDVPVVALCHKSYSGQAGAASVRPCLTFDQYNNSAFKEGFNIAFHERLARIKQRLLSRLSADNSIWPEDSPLARVMVVGIAVFSGLLLSRHC